MGGAPSSLPAHQVRILEAAPPALHLQAWRNEWLFPTSISPPNPRETFPSLQLGGSQKVSKASHTFPSSWRQHKTRCHLIAELAGISRWLPSRQGKLLLPGGALQHLGKRAGGRGRRWRPPMKSAGRRGGENESRLLEDSCLGCVEPPLPPVGRATACVLLVAGGP